MSNADDLEQLTRAARLGYGGWTVEEAATALRTAFGRPAPAPPDCAIGPDCPVCTNTLPPPPILSTEETPPDAES